MRFAFREFLCAFCESSPVDRCIVRWFQVEQLRHSAADVCGFLGRASMNRWLKADSRCVFVWTLVGADNADSGALVFTAHIISCPCPFQHGGLRREIHV